MSFIMIPEELLGADISAAQLRALIHIINNTYSSGKYAGCCCLGYRILADRCFTDKSAIIKTIRQLEQLGFVEVDKREKFNRSNALRLTLENGLKCCSSRRAGLSCSLSDRCQNTTDKGCQNTTDKGCQKPTDGCLKPTDGCLNTTPHIDLKFKNLNLKTQNARACAGDERCLKNTYEKGHNATGDGAPVQSKPTEESAKDVMSASSAANDADQTLLRDMQAKFTDIFADLSLSKAGNTYILRKKGKYAVVEEIRLREVVYWLCARGLDARIMDTQTRVLGEVLLEEVA